MDAADDGAAAATRSANSAATPGWACLRLALALPAGARHGTVHLSHYLWTREQGQVSYDLWSRRFLLVDRYTFCSEAERRRSISCAIWSFVRPDAASSLLSFW